MNIGVKLTTVIILLNVIGTGILIAAAIALSSAQISALVYQNTVSTVEKGGEQVKEWVERYLDAARTLAQIMEDYETVELNSRRAYFDNMLKSVIDRNAEVIGTWTCWEPNALDGLDSQYANTPDSDMTGRYIPFFIKTGGVIKEPLAYYDQQGDGDYYQVPFRSGQESVIEPYLYPVAGKDVLYLSLTVPIKKNGRVIGVVGVDIDIEKIQAMITTDHAVEEGLVAVFSNSGIVAARQELIDPAFDKGSIGKNMRETEQQMGNDLNDMAQAVKNGRFYDSHTWFSNRKENMRVIAAPFTMGDSTTPWSFMVAIPEKSIMAPVYRMLTIYIIIAGVMLIIIFAVAWIMARSITNPIKYTITMLNDMEGDLTRRLVIKSRDEIGNLAGIFNNTFDTMKHLIALIKDKAGGLSKTGIELSGNTSETVGAINVISARIQDMESLIQDQSVDITETNTAMEYIMKTIDKLNGHIADQAAGVATSSSAIEEMIANIRSVVQTLVKNNENVKNLTEASEIGKTGLENVSTDIQEIAQESEGLMEINAVMNNIASQTNLLSMNAAIEAAHAGEAGKGFAVVADEIRKLAESSSEQSKTTAAMLKKIKASIDTITQSAHEVLTRFEAIDGGIKTVNLQEDSIRSAMEEQEAGSKQILEAISRLNELTDLVKSGAMEMKGEGGEVIRRSDKLADITAKIGNGMKEIVTGATQITHSVNRISGISEENKDNITALFNEMGKFKV
jgi:methyl-accepting chemotaxis protein